MQRVVAAAALVMLTNLAGCEEGAPTPSAPNFTSITLVPLDGQPAAARIDLMGRVGEPRGPGEYVELYSTTSPLGLVAAVEPTGTFVFPGVEVIPGDTCMGLTYGYDLAPGPAESAPVWYQTLVEDEGHCLSEGNQLCTALDAFSQCVCILQLARSC